MSGIRKLEVGGHSSRFVAWLRTLAAAALVAVAAAPSWARSPAEVDFDTAEVVAVRDVTSPEFAAANPGEKLIEARFTISSLVRHGSDADLAHFLYQIGMADDGQRVVDYLPKTELASPVAGPVSVEQKSQDTFTIGGEATGKFESLATAKLNASKTTGEQLQVKYDLLPPKELIAASGTIRRQHGVYFKLKPSRQTSLEGAKQFVCLLAVPKDWRQGKVRVHCEALANVPATFSSPATTTRGGSGEFLVGLHLVADAAAKATIERELREAHRQTAARLAAEKRKSASYFTPLKSAWSGLKPAH